MTSVGGVGELAEPIIELAEALANLKTHEIAVAAPLRLRALALLHAGSPTKATPPVHRLTVDDDDAWGMAWRRKLGDLTPGQRALFVHLSVCGRAPSARLRQRAVELCKAPGSGALLQAMVADAIQATAPLTALHVDRGPARESNLLTYGNAASLGGAIWAAAGLKEPWVLDSLVLAGLHFGTSDRGSDEPRYPSLSYTAVEAIGSMGSMGSLAATDALRRLRAGTSDRYLSKHIQRQLARAEAHVGVEDPRITAEFRPR